jgi:hypothetical protein
MELLRGIWTFRSFLNVERGEVPKSGIQLWQAELYLDVDQATNSLFGHLGERVDLTPATDAEGKPYPFLSIEGDYTEGDLVTLTFRAVGRRGSAWEKWIYDHKCVLLPKWMRQPNFSPAELQKPTLVGTVIRTVEHDGAPAGATYSFYAVKHDFVEARMATPLPEAVIVMLASPEMRLHHQLWHASRDNWDRLDADQKEWLRANNCQPGPVNAERSAGLRPQHLANHSGEDFLFMHRRMIKAVRDIAGAAAPQGWKRLPEPAALADFAPGRLKKVIGNIDGNGVPPAWVIPDDANTSAWLASLRTSATFNGRFRSWEVQYTNPAWLASVSLGELGAWIEFTIHNWMHMRWTSVQRDPALSGLAVPEGRQDDDFANKWFKPENDHLGATFSSHVNPVFWRLHGWVDDRVEDWFRAQEAARPGTIKRRQFKDVSWFEKDGRWVNLDEPWEGPVLDGGHDHGHGAMHGHGGMDVELMKRAIVVIFRGVGALGKEMGLEALRATALPRIVSRFQNWL